MLYADFAVSSLCVTLKLACGYFFCPTCGDSISKQFYIWWLLDCAPTFIFCLNHFGSAFATDLLTHLVKYFTSLVTVYILLASILPGFVLSEPFSQNILQRDHIPAWLCYVPMNVGIFWGILYSVLGCFATRTLPSRI